jgi:hypothetical protein
MNGGALLAVSIAGWLHHLTTTPGPDGTLAGNTPETINNPR